jgi:hypothetical protein
MTHLYRYFARGVPNFRTSWFNNNRSCFECWRYRVRISARIQIVLTRELFHDFPEANKMLLHYLELGLVLFHILPNSFFTSLGIPCNVVCTGARGTVVGWRAMLQPGSSRVRLPMRALDFSIDVIFPAALWSTQQPITGMSTRNLWASLSLVV